MTPREARRARREAERKAKKAEFKRMKAEQTHKAEGHPLTRSHLFTRPGIFSRTHRPGQRRPRTCPPQSRDQPRLAAVRRQNASLTCAATRPRAEPGLGSEP